MCTVDPIHSVTLSHHSRPLWQLNFVRKFLRLHTYIYTHWSNDLFINVLFSQMSISYIGRDNTYANDSGIQLLRPTHEMLKELSGQKCLYFKTGTTSSQFIFHWDRNTSWSAFPVRKRARNGPPAAAAGWTPPTSRGQPPGVNFGNQFRP
jgi:hypothetical protein